MKGIADFGSHALLHERSELAFIVNLDQFLGPIGRVGYVELHLDEGSAVKTGGAKLSVGREVEVVVVERSGGYRIFCGGFCWV